ncbi:hypothetical protein Hypma_012274 [Hypsizygus marmoreus]|uniref:Uncharacterized protein n=1 Tax=Hypsizygus marmoreus TaxID=39966 RepID=A0A369JH86_HYPMA|nr:hypothetical protein Hypma_012274 [Hypsizygus marmoreus]
MWNTLATLFPSFMTSSSPEHATRVEEGYEVKDDRRSLKRESTRPERNGRKAKRKQLSEDISSGLTETAEAACHDQTRETNAVLDGNDDENGESDEHDHDHSTINTFDNARRDRLHIDELTRKLKAVELYSEQLDQQLQNSKRQRWDAGREIRALKESERKLTLELDSAQRRGEECILSHQRQTSELQLIKGELRRVEAEYVVTRQLLDERTTELKAAHTFINQADSLSGADVISMVSSLNAEILQCAAFVADSSDFSHGPTQTEANILQARENATQVLGEDIVDALFSQRPADAADFDPTRVQIALQVCMASYCSRVIQDWSVNGGKSTWLAEVYSRLWDAETQPVAGRWRSMTRAYIKGKQDSDNMLTRLVHALADIMVVAGCSLEDAYSNAFYARFQERLSMVVDLTIRLRTAIGENITSMDLLPYIFDPRTDFDPNLMADTYEDERDSDRSHRVNEKVAGTTELGLMRRTKGQAGFVDSVLLKPKIILYSALQEDINDAH